MGTSLSQNTRWTAPTSCFGLPLIRLRLQCRARTHALVYPHFWALPAHQPLPPASPTGMRNVFPPSNQSQRPQGQEEEEEKARRH